MQTSENGYSGIEKFDVDHECESAYFRHHRMLKAFCNGGHADHRSVAKALRPFLEGYVHRRFPTWVPQDLMFGHAISFIKETASPNPVAFAHTLVDELRELNDFAGRFHHDTNADAEAMQVAPGELQIFCQRALHLVYSGEPIK